jgi:recombination protein RecT
MAGTDVATRTPHQQLIAQIRGDQFKNEITNALPGGISPDRFVRVTVTALNQAPELIACERSTLFSAVIKCAQDGLLPDGREAALVKFGDTATYMPMVGGLRKIAAKHAWSLTAYVVHAGDTFKYQLGIDPSITHEPPPLGDDRGEAIGAYAVARNKITGEKLLDVMSKAEIERIRQESKGKNAGPWAKHWGEMARKTVARRLFKQLPLGDLDERDASIIEQADVDAVHEPEEHMTVEEANVSAGIGVARPLNGDGPVDDIDDADFTDVEPTLEDGEQAQLGFQPPPSAGVDDDPTVQAAVEAGKFEIPNGQHKGLTLAELNEKSDKAGSWFKWAVSNIETPAVYRDAIIAFCRVHHPEVLT